MRVVSGQNKGLVLKSVPGKTTRPTSDKVKEAVFNMVGPYFKGGMMLDLYAGSGAMGIEAISRGMEKAVFVDRERKAVETVYTNIKAAGLEARAEVFRTEAHRALKALKKKSSQFRFIFLDPPYAKQKLNEELAFIDENELLQEDGFIVAEHSSKIFLESTFLNFSKQREETYGDTVITIFQSNRKEGSE
ncbi:16S rRNA (guanine(966)-N(2))-methyltransferase RsmD [Salipaludibacillus aurantiacus]|uniref:16S rRNA (Guanine(966)-N(2))-methyltransferase RsmD n=1 Tax=Salipaludibacillus aurantiacus TaxID=1601833 RepID=A0A1H9X0S7_9BACI|nr:16S rRNA (guanine(966)-N(2))-methyltransferase RsmD [Salipaludibacillus aurantiacus]SES39776.1 16S rRNA (guanine(966)-N(2))-methyltransferase RsmD [Salipaludibacillus aurantiacus]